MSDEHDGRTYQDWYAENKDTVAERRRQRYQSDPDYREKAKARSKAYRDKRRKERLAAGDTGPSRQHGPIAFHVDVGGEQCRAWTVSKLAADLDRSVEAVNHWQKIGLMPQTPLRSSRNDRLFTDGMILVVKLAVLKRGAVSRDDPDFCAEIEEGWRGLGIPV